MNIALIKEAMEKQQVIEITYVKANNQQTIRSLEPYEIKDGKLWAWCIAKGGIRQFKLDHITGIRLLNQHYDARFEVKL